MAKKSHAGVCSPYEIGSYLATFADEKFLAHDVLVGAQGNGDGCLSQWGPVHSLLLAGVRCATPMLNPERA